MIILNKEKKVMKISLVTGKELSASLNDVYDYFSDKIRSEDIKIYGKLPFLFQDERVVFGNLEVRTTNDLFNIYMNIISSSMKANLLSEPPFKKGK